MLAFFIRIKDVDARILPLLCYFWNLVMQLARAEGQGEGVITFYSELRSQHTTISTQCNKLRSLELSWDKEN